MPHLLILLLVAAFGILFSVSIRRASELFVLRVHGRGVPVKLIRGRIPRPLLRDLTEVIAASPSRGTLRVLTSRGQPEVEARGTFPRDALQRIRNLVGLYSVAKIRAGAGRDET